MHSFETLLANQVHFVTPILRQPHVTTNYQTSLV